MLEHMSNLRQNNLIDKNYCKNNQNNYLCIDNSHVVSLQQQR